MIYIGIDASSRYSRLVACNDEFVIVGRHAGKALGLPNRETVKEHFRRLLFEFFKLTRTHTDECGGICLCIRQGDETIHDFAEIAQELSITCPVGTAGYLQSLLATEQRGEDGIIIVSGSNAMGYAFVGGKEYTCGGTGYFTDDLGSGFRMGMDTITACIKSSDGREQKTSLTGKVCEALSIDNIINAKDIVLAPGFSHNSVSQLAYAVKYAAENGDEVAQSIEKKTAEDLCNMVVALKKQSDIKNMTVMVGGNILLSNDRVRKVFSQRVMETFPEADIVAVKEKPETGAMYLAAKAYSK